MLKNNLKLIITAIILIAGISIFFFTVKEVTAETITVDDDGGQNYNKIQDAVDNAIEGDTIRVYKGTYKENLVINKALTLMGNGSTDTIINGWENVININNKDVNISKFFVIGSGKVCYGILCSNNNVISNCNISNCSKALWFRHSSNNNTISNCNISNNSKGIYFSYTSNNNIISSCNISDNSLFGIKFWNSSNNTILNCHISNNGIYGFYFEYLSNNNKILNCKVSNHNYGIKFYDSNNNIISDCNISNYYTGIKYSHSCNNTISSCYISNNSNGIILNFSINNIITGCNILNNGDGINLRYSSNNNTISSCNILNNGDGINLGISCNNSTISSCNISYNDKVGIYIWSSSNDNIIFHNNFTENYKNAIDDCSNQWDDGKEGNSWDDYKGEDNDGDGIGDIPYNISGGDNQDRYPLVEALTKEERVTTTGTITGIVKDEKGNPIRNAVVELLNTTFSTKTDEYGVYILENVLSGTYTILVYKEGYLDTKKYVTIENGKTTWMDIELKRESAKEEEKEEQQISIGIILILLIIGTGIVNLLLKKWK